MAMSHKEMWLEKGALSFRALLIEHFEASVAPQAMSSSALLSQAIRKNMARSSRLLLYQMAW
jgi:hypothetical protein